MKIAMTLFKYFPYGGLQRDFLRMARVCADRGHRVTVFAGEWTGDKPDWLDIRMIPLKKWSNHGRAAEFERKFGRIIRQETFDLTVGFNRMAYLDFYFAADNCLIMRDRARHPDWWLGLVPRYRAWHRQERAVVGREADTVIMYITPHQKRDYQAVYGTPAERFRYLPPGIDVTCRRPENAQEKRDVKRRELGLSENEILLLLVGSNFRGKGVDRLFRAAAQVPDSVHYRIFIAGDCSPKGFEELAEELNIRSRVTFGGGRGDVADLLLAADLMVHPARDEATGTVLTEALAAGLPVICSEACGFHNFVEESGGIVTREPFRQAELDQQLKQALTPESLTELKRRALEYSRTADFYRRAEVAADLFEDAFKLKNNITL
jgi:UDP-glucose:(heptosyl)LPS alpha-1,3-glucosyltransferase